MSFRREHGRFVLVRCDKLDAAREIWRIEDRSWVLKRFRHLPAAAGQR
jgi:hypothetical protein